MKNTKRLLAMLLALMMVLSIAACGDKNGNNGGQNGNPSNSGTGDDAGTGDEGTGGATGEGAGRYTYTFTDAAPNTWSPTDWQMNNEGTIWGYCVTPMWEFMINDTKDGYDIVPSAASELPQDITAEFAEKAKYGVPEDATEGYVWRIKLNDQVAWEDGQKITADDYIYTLQQFLNPQMSNYRGTSWYSGNGALVNAKKYYNSAKAGEIGYMDSLGTLGFSSVAEAEAAGYTEFGVDLANFWGMPDAGTVSITDETMYRDEAVEEGQPEDYVSGKYMYDTYFAPGCPYEGSASQYIYVGQVVEECSWEDVGVIKVDDYTFDLVLVTPLTPFYAVYNLNSLCCVREDLYEANKQQTGDIIKSSYGTSPEKFMSYGPYTITSYQADKELRYTKNENWWGYQSDIYEGLYQTTDIVTMFIDDHATQMNLFLQGVTSSQGLTSEDMKTYGNSDYVYYTPGDYTWKLSFTTDLEKLKSEETPGENHSILAYKDFREAMSWAIDRQDYVASCTASGLVSLGLLSRNYISNPDDGTVYRDTPYAETALCDVYGASSVDQITGYDAAKATQLFQSAYDQCLADGNIAEGDKVVLEFHQYSSDDTYVRILNFFQAAIDKATTGTSLEGRITIKQVEDPNYYENMKNGLCDIAMTAWGGAAMNPFGVMQCYCDTNMLNELYGFSPKTEKVTINVNGEEITKSFADWYVALCETEYAAADVETRTHILAEMESAMLSLYFCFPIFDTNSATLYQQRIVMQSEEYINVLVARGGVAGMTYTMDDAEWSAYCNSQNNQLTY